MIKEYKQEIRQKERPREYLSVVLFIIYLFNLSNCTYEFIQKYLLYTQLFVLFCPLSWCYRKLFIN